MPQADAAPSRDRVFYELPMASQGVASSADETADTGLSESLPRAMLLRNVMWFCRLRWAVAAILACFGVMSLFPGLLRVLEIKGRTDWPFIAAGVLVLANMAYRAYARASGRTGTIRSLKLDLMAQIVGDLLVLTVVVHYIGSTTTFVAFAYLFHIVLACIFFTRPGSLAVVALACVLYASCVAAERFDVVAAAGIFVAPAWTGPPSADVDRGLHVLSAMGIWIVVWYLASYLSALVRQRDYELGDTNRRLIKAQEDRARHVVHTTHELKAPFAAIYANVQLLLEGYCGELPEEALDVARRIAKRCRRLTGEIQQMLHMANLDSAGDEPADGVDLDLADMLRWSIEQVSPVAELRHVTIEADLAPARTRGVEDHFKMLFRNLMTNAVAYSHEKGVVRVQCASGNGEPPKVRIADSGIGIPADRLPRIFDDYFRTQEAVKHNPDSSGLGLAIVRRVVSLHKIRLRVQSSPGAGTVFELTLPSPDQGPGDAATDKET